MTEIDVGWLYFYVFFSQKMGISRMDSSLDVNSVLLEGVFVHEHSILFSRFATTVLVRSQGNGTCENWYVSTSNDNETYRNVARSELSIFWVVLSSLQMYTACGLAAGGAGVLLYALEQSVNAAEVPLHPPDYGFHYSSPFGSHDAAGYLFDNLPLL